MKKILLPILLFAILLTMSDCNDNETEREPEFYPFEVTNLKYEIEKGELYLIKLTWDNPTDPNFDHVRIDGFNLAQDVDSYQFVAPILDVRTIQCVDKQGKASRGVRCDYVYK